MDENEAVYMFGKFNTHFYGIEEDDDQLEVEFPSGKN